jgi:hypothetical protein
LASLDAGLYDRMFPPPPLPQNRGGSAQKRSPDAALDRMFPPGQWVSVSLTPQEEEEIFAESTRFLPAWFHYELREGVLQPRSLADKKKLMAALEKC